MTLAPSDDPCPALAPSIEHSQMENTQAGTLSVRDLATKELQRRSPDTWLPPGSHRGTRPGRRQSSRCRVRPCGALQHKHNKMMRRTTLKKTLSRSANGRQTPHRTPPRQHHCSRPPAVRHQTPMHVNARGKLSSTTVSRGTYRIDARRGPGIGLIFAPRALRPDTARQASAAAISHTQQRTRMDALAAQRYHRVPQEYGASALMACTGDIDASRIGAAGYV